MITGEHGRRGEIPAVILSAEDNSMNLIIDIIDLETYILLSIVQSTLREEESYPLPPISKACCSFRQHCKLTYTVTAWEEP